MTKNDKANKLYDNLIEKLNEEGKKELNELLELERELTLEEGQ